MIKNLKINMSIFVGAWLFALLVVYFNNGYEQFAGLLPWFLITLPIAAIVSIGIDKFKQKNKKKKHD